MRKRFIAYLITLAVGAGAAVAVATPAHATTWYSYAGSCGYGGIRNCTVQYTGSWPGGLVRAQGDFGEYEIALESSPNPGVNPFVIVATQFPQNTGSAVTPAVNVGKVSWYEVFVKVTPQGPWLPSDAGAIYLGD